MRRTIRHDVQDCIARHSKTTDASLRDRNVNIVLHQYGFGDSAWPSLEETARAWDVGTRERVRQIKSRFLKSARSELLPTLREFSAILATSRCWTQSELTHRLLQEGLIDGQFSFRGILSLAKDMYGTIDYKIYTPTLVPMTRASINRFDEYFLIHRSDIEQVTKIYRRAKRAHGICGMARLNVATGGEDDDRMRRIVEKLVLFSPNVWVDHTKGDTWYLFENRDSVFFNSTAKVFSTIDGCDLNELAEAYLRPIRRRSTRCRIPPADVVINYIQSSSLFSVNDGFVRSTRSYQKDLTTIETDTVRYLRDVSGGCSYGDVKNHLIDKGHSKHNVTVTVAYSPLVSVDKSDRPGRHRYHLIGGRVGVRREQLTESEKRFARFARMLQDLSSTDADVLTKERQEQEILRDWLFEGKETQCCAICGKRYDVRALVAAHKKRRKDCVDVERRDPRVVMPLCLFGCDYLYEHGYVIVRNGKLCRGVQARDEASREYISRILDSPVVEEWLRGPSHYFETRG